MTGALMTMRVKASQQACD